MTDYLRLPAFGEGERVQVVIETPRGARAKIKYENGMFRYSRPLALGLAYPFDWGFIPSTCGEDGDPLDALVIHDAASPPGTIIPSRLIGVLEVEQTEKGEKKRNDRFVFRPDPVEYPLQDSPGLSDREKEELEQFFAAAVLRTGKTLKFLGWKDGAAAMVSLRQGVHEIPAKDGWRGLFGTIFRAQKEGQDIPKRNQQQ
jgi:inorganic pyrophosphatase